MTQALEQSIAELLRASRRDEDVIALEIDDANFGLHAQQAVEKMLKALIAAHDVRYSGPITLSPWLRIWQTCTRWCRVT